MNTLTIEEFEDLYGPCDLEDIPDVAKILGDNGELLYIISDLVGGILTI